MKKILMTLALALIALCPLGAEAGDILANPRNAEPISEETFKAMLIGKEKFWSSGSEVTIALLKSDPEVEATLTRYSGMTASKFKNHWQRMAFSGRGKMPKLFDSIEELIEYVNSHEGAIAIVPSGAKADRLRRLDLSRLKSRFLSIAGR